MTNDTKRPVATKTNAEYDAEGDPSRFGWSSMDQITPLHGDSTPYDEQGLAELKTLHRQRALAREQAAEAASTDAEYNPPTADEIAAAFN